MTPATLLLLIQGIQAAIAAAPQIAALAIKAKDFITELFKGGVITKAQQTAVHEHIDAICAAAASGQVAPEWTVEPDPKS